MSCKFCKDDLSYIEYDWDARKSNTGEIIEIPGKCTKCGQNYVEKYDYIGYGAVSNEQ